MACDRQSEWCTRTHHTCHLTVPLPALSHIPSPLLHTSPSHHTPPSHPPHSTTPPTHLTPSHIPIAANILSKMHFLCLKALAHSMSTTLATKTRANSSLSHEPKTRSPPSLSPQQAYIANRAWSRSYYIVGRAFQRLLMSHARYNGLSGLRCTPGCVWESFRTSHLEIQAHAWPLVVPGCDRFATFTTAR